MWNYSKLCFNTKYPWESAPAKDIEAQQYVLHDVTTDTYDKANVTSGMDKRRMCYIDVSSLAIIFRQSVTGYRR